MLKDLKNTLDMARANLDSIKRQHATAEGNKDKIIARRQVLTQALKTAAERLEAAQMSNLRGLTSDSEVTVLRSEHQTARNALVQQNEDEEMAMRGMNMSHEFAEATQAIEAARSEYFGAISERIEKSLGGDAKLRSRLVSNWVASAFMVGREPEITGHPHEEMQWESVLLACFTLPTADELRRSVAEFSAEYDPDMSSKK